MKRLLLAVAVMGLVGMASMAEARGRRCGSCSGGGCATACDTGACADTKAAAKTDTTQDKAQVAKEQVPPAPTEEKAAEAKKSTSTASTESNSGRRRARRR